MTRHVNAADFERDHERLLGLLRDGLALVDAAREADVAQRTAERWLTKGRRDPEGKYGQFAAQVDALRADRQISDGQPMDEEEFKACVAAAARKGSVPAMKIAWQILLDERLAGNQPSAGRLDEPLAGIDEVARQRMARSTRNQVDS